MRHTAWGIVLVGLIVAAYAPVLRCGFIWDDDQYVYENPRLTAPGGLRDIWLNPRSTPQYYPLVFTTFWIEQRLWDNNPVGYHIVNVLLHAASAVLLWRLLLRLEVSGAWLIAAVFGLHPVHVESVAWITERKNVLSALLAVAAAICYLRFALSNRSIGWLLAASALFIFGLLSKTVISTLPAALILLVWWRRSGRLRARDVLPLIPWLLIGATMGCLTTHLERTRVGAVGAAWDLSFIQRLLIAGRAVWFYAAKLIWPAPLIFVYPRWFVDPHRAALWLFPVSALAMVIALWLLRRRIGRGPLVAALYFGGTLIPALGFINIYPMRYSFVADHFQYLASVGLIALVIAMFARIAERISIPQPMQIAIAAMLLLLLTYQSARQCAIYRDAETVWRDTIAKNDRAWMAYNNLGRIYLRRGGAENLASARRNFELSLAASPNGDALVNLGMMLAAGGDTSAAIAHFNRALELEPRSATAEYNLANALARTGQTDDAIVHYRRCIELAPANFLAHNNLGIELARRGSRDDAISEFRHAIELNPSHASAHYNLASMLAERGATEEAIAHLREALRIQPDYAKAREKLDRLSGAVPP